MPQGDDSELQHPARRGEMAPPAPPPEHPGLILPQWVTRSDGPHVPNPQLRAVMPTQRAWYQGSGPSSSPAFSSARLEKWDEMSGEGWSSFPLSFCLLLGKPKESKQNGGQSFKDRKASFPHLLSLSWLRALSIGIPSARDAQGPLLLAPGTSLSEETPPRGRILTTLRSQLENHREVPAKRRAPRLLDAGTKPSACSMNISVCQRCRLARRIKISPGLQGCCRHHLRGAASLGKAKIPGGSANSEPPEPQSADVEPSYLKHVVPSCKSHRKNPRWCFYSLRPYFIHTE